MTTYVISRNLQWRSSDLLDRVVHGFTNKHDGINYHRIVCWLLLISKKKKGMYGKISMVLRNFQVNGINSNNNRLEQREKEEKSIGTHFTNTSMMFLQTSTLTDSFWNMSMNGKNLSYKKLVFYKFKSFFPWTCTWTHAKKKCKTGILDIVGPEHMNSYNFNINKSIHLL